MLCICSLSFNAFAADVSYSVASVKDRPTKSYGSEIRVDVTDGFMYYGLSSRNISNVNKTVAKGGLAGSVDVYGVNVHGRAGLGETFETTVKRHEIYFGEIGATYNVIDKVAVSLDAGYQHAFRKNIFDRNSSVSVSGAYAFTPKTSLNLTLGRTYGDTKLNVAALSYNVKF